MSVQNEYERTLNKAEMLIKALKETLCRAQLLDRTIRSTMSSKEYNLLSSDLSNVYRRLASAVKGVEKVLPRDKNIHRTIRIPNEIYNLMLSDVASVDALIDGGIFESISTKELTKSQIIEAKLMQIPTKESVQKNVVIPRDKYERTVLMLKEEGITFNKYVVARIKMILETPEDDDDWFRK